MRRIPTPLLPLHNVALVDYLALLKPIQDIVTMKASQWQLKYTDDLYLVGALASTISLNAKSPLLGMRDAVCDVGLTGR